MQPAFGITQTNRLRGGVRGFRVSKKKYRTKKGFGDELETHW